MGQIHKNETSLDDLFSKFAIDPEDELVFPVPEKEQFLDDEKKKNVLDKKNRNAE